MGVVLTDKGVKADKNKQETIRAWPTPQDKDEVRRLLGVVTYLARISDGLATKSGPLRALLKKNAPFVWEDNEQKAFEEIKDLISSTPVLRYFDPTEPVQLQVDASSCGSGACLMQGGSPFAIPY